MKTINIILAIIFTLGLFISIVTSAHAGHPKKSKYQCNKIGQPKVHPYYKHRLRHFGPVVKTISVIPTKPKFVVSNCVRLNLSELY